jgi:hypothetical protein
VSVAGTGYVPMNAARAIPCATAAIAARRRARWPDWSFADDREARCRRMILPGDAYVQLPTPRARFCVACAAGVLGLPVSFEPEGSVEDPWRSPSCC